MGFGRVMRASTPTSSFWYTVLEASGLLLPSLYFCVLVGVDSHVVGAGRVCIGERCVGVKIGRCSCFCSGVRLGEYRFRGDSVCAHPWGDGLFVRNFGF